MYYWVLPCIFFLLWFTVSLTDYLVIELDADAGVLVPSHLVESVLIELSKAVELALQTARCSEIGYVVADAGHQLDSAVAEYVKLFYLALPETVVQDEVAQWCE